MPAEWDKLDSNAPLTSPMARFIAGRPLVYQPVLLLATTAALRQQHTCAMHRQWIAFVISAMPYLGRALAHFACATAAQICHNLELLAPLYELGRCYKKCVVLSRIFTCCFEFFLKNVLLVESSANIMRNLRNMLRPLCQYYINLELFLLVITPHPMGEQSIVLISGSTCLIFTNFLCMLPMSVTRSRLMASRYVIYLWFYV